MRKKVYFITPCSFPTGGAGTIRKYALAKGLIAHGLDVHIITTVNDRIDNKKEVRTCEKIDYHTSAPKSLWGGGKLRKLIHLYYGFFNALKFVFKDSKNNDETLITTNEFRFFKCLCVKFIAKLCSAHLFTELNENPMVTYKKQNIVSSKYRYWNINFSLRLYDNIFVMTSNLKELLSTKFKIKKKVSILNNAVDFDRFDNLEKFDYENQTLFYAGSLSFKKDSLDLLLYAFKKIIEIYPKANLMICYFSNDKYLNIFNKKVEELNLINNIRMKADVPNDKIPNMMKKAQVLIVVRETNEQTSYGFSTKLVEYLASGRPVITSAVSDIPLYLKNKEDALIINHISIDNIFNAICYSFDNSEYVDRIGKQGYLKAKIHFNNIIESEKIISTN